MNMHHDRTGAHRRPLARRLAVFLGVGGCAVAAVLGTGATGWAAPTKGDVWILACGDASVTVQLTPGGGDPVWGDDGALYHLKTFDVRIYRGEFATEPDIDPIVVSSKSTGNRNGQGEAMACSFRDYNPDHNATAFIDISVTG